MTRAEACEVVFVAAEGLFVGVAYGAVVAGEFEFVGAVLVGEDLPGDFVRGHCVVDLEGGVCGC